MKWLLLMLKAVQKQLCFPKRKQKLHLVNLISIHPYKKEIKSCISVARPAGAARVGCKNAKNVPPSRLCLRFSPASNHTPVATWHSAITHPLPLSPNQPEQCTLSRTIHSMPLVVLLQVLSFCPVCQPVLPLGPSQSSSP